MIQQFLVR